MQSIEADSDVDEMTSPRVPHGLDYVGLVATLAPFVISFRNSTSSTFSATTVRADGTKETTSQSHATFNDPAAIAGGAIGLIMAVATLLLWKKTARSKRGLRVGLTVALWLLGAFQLVVRGGLLS